MKDAKNLKKRVVFTIIFNILITLVEIGGGLLSNSLALVSDAIHNFADTASLILSYISIKVGEKKKDIRHTFGYKRIEILSAFVNALALWVISIFLIIHSYKRFIKEEIINSEIMLFVAIVGLIANFISVLLLHKHSKETLNIKAAYLHLMGDTFSSIGVVIGSILIFFYKIYWIDPLVTLIIVLYILKESWEVLKESINILMQGVPENIDIKEVQKDLEKIPMVINVHHTHIWSLSDNNIFFESHIRVKDMAVSKTYNISKKIKKLLKDKYKINHITIQYESEICNDT